MAAAMKAQNTAPAKQRPKKPPRDAPPGEPGSA
jgi:hypothetical protein